MRKPTTNPMAALAEWKASHAKTAPQPPMQAVRKTEKFVKGKTEKAGNQHIFYEAKFAQLNRQFTLANTATAHCKLHYAENYHHKQKLAAECNRLRTDLKGGKHLLNDMLKPLGLTLSPEQRTALKRFNLAVAYLNRHLKSVAQTVAEVDGLSREELAARLAKAAEGAEDES